MRTSVQILATRSPVLTGGFTDFTQFVRARTMILPPNLVMTASFHTLPVSLFSDLSTTGWYVVWDRDSLQENCRHNLTPLLPPPKLSGIRTYVFQTRYREPVSASRVNKVPLSQDCVQWSVFANSVMKLLSDCNFLKNECRPWN